MSDALDRVLQLVADGRLTAAEAGPILDALAASAPAADEPEPAPNDDPSSPARGSATAIRIEINEAGRKVVNLRVPVALGRIALDRIPGLSGTNAELVRRAIAEGRSGTLLSIDDEGSGVRIALE